MPLQSFQPAIAIENASHAVSMEWDSRTAPRDLWSSLSGLASANLVIGIGQGLLEAVGAQVDGMKPFLRQNNGRTTLPSTPHDLWTLVVGDSPGEAFELCERLKQQIGKFAHLSEVTPMFVYRKGRDLTGYTDGINNPKGEEGLKAALIHGNQWENGSFAFVQRYLHFRERLHALSEEARDHVFGRRQSDDTEIEDAPEAAHVNRVRQLRFDPHAYILRRSMPWGDARPHGLQFIAFMNDLSHADRHLERMLGRTDGHVDAVLHHTQAETGAFYFVPPVLDGCLVLPKIAPEEVMTDDGFEEVATDGIRLRVNVGKCIHSRNCVLARPDVFVPNVVGPWLHPELASVEELVEIANNCPSGAIQYTRLDGGQQEQPVRRNLIRLRENGPLSIHGSFQIGETQHMRATLCRCGQSQEKPFCDGSHVSVGFSATGEPRSFAGDPVVTSGGSIQVIPIANGPLVIHGALDLVSGTGRTISQSSGPTLCRCGHSENKPYCDGSHARVGFRAPD